ncbi:MAG: 50S ribosomal protein L11 methyltransferase [Acidobacteriia bacterium]|nr:50S ribosomal protein L11 methyltransferase [Terriglobia bacterium]
MITHFYNLAGYAGLIADRVRTDAYAQALRGAIRPGSVVLEIGTGPGIFAVLACQLGAGRVIAIEASPVIQLARDVAAANHCTERIEFIEDLSTNVNFPIRADVIVSDLHGVLPLFEHHIPSIVDARRRFLAPGGMLIPRKEVIWAAVVEAPDRYGKIVDPWEHNGLGQDLGAARKLVVNEILKARFTPAQMLTEPLVWATLDYSTMESPDVQGELCWSIQRDATGHGIAVWFESELADGVHFSNAPGEPETIYACMFFPWLNPVPLAAGQRVRVDLLAKLLGSDYFWRWTTKVGSMESPEKIITQFDQSQLHGSILSPAALHRGASTFVPQISEKGRMQQRTLELMDGSAPLEEIAKRLAAEFPLRFTCWQQALSYAGELSREYSR